jgi:hypothetical protein
MFSALNLSVKKRRCHFCATEILHALTSWWNCVSQQNSFEARASLVISQRLA